MMIQWPTTLPLPLVSEQGNPQNAVAISDDSFAQHNRRARFRYSTYALSWELYLGITQRDTFEAFYDATLFNGAACFQIDLKYPETDTLTPWMVRILGPYSSVYDGSGWSVSGNFEMVKQLDLYNTFAPLIDEQNFLVKQPEFLTDLTKDVPYATRDGYLFNVKA